MFFSSLFVLSQRLALIGLKRARTFFTRPTLRSFFTRPTHRLLRNRSPGDVRFAQASTAQSVTISFTMRAR
jgi:hypothetical protein